MAQMGYTCLLTQHGLSVQTVHSLKPSGDRYQTPGFVELTRNSARPRWGLPQWRELRVTRFQRAVVSASGALHINTTGILTIFSFINIHHQIISGAVDEWLNPPRRRTEHLITASCRLGMRDTCLSTSTVLTFT